MSGRQATHVLGDQPTQPHAPVCLDPETLPQLFAEGAVHVRKDPVPANPDLIRAYLRFVVAGFAESKVTCVLLRGNLPLPGCRYLLHSNSPKLKSYTELPDTTNNRFSYRLLYVEWARYYLIECTCKNCGTVILGSVYKRVRQDEARHAAECTSKRALNIRV